MNDSVNKVGNIAEQNLADHANGAVQNSIKRCPSSFGTGQI